MLEKLSRTQMLTKGKKKQLDNDKAMKNRMFRSKMKAVFIYLFIYFLWAYLRNSMVEANLS